MMGEFVAIQGLKNETWSTQGFVLGPGEDLGHPPFSTVGLITNFRSVPLDGKGFNYCELSGSGEDPVESKARACQQLAIFVR